MIKPCFGAIIGGVVGLLIGWIIQTFVLDLATIEEIERITNIPFYLIIGIIGFVAGSIISFIFKEE